MKRLFISVISRVVSFAPTQGFLLVLNWNINYQTNTITRRREAKCQAEKFLDFLTTLKFNISYNRNSSSWFEDNMGSIRHDFIAIQLVQIVDTSQSETVNENKKQKQITSI